MEPLVEEVERDRVVDARQHDARLLDDVDLQRSIGRHGSAGRAEIGGVRRNLLHPNDDRALVSPDLSTLFGRAHDGDAEALDRLLALLYDELIALARRQRGRRGAAETINTTALVHEAYERLAGNERLQISDRVHFFRIAGRAMRGVLVDYARAQRTQKRGGRARPLPLDLAGPLADGAPRIDEALAVDDALRQLEAFDARQARIVECRYYAGLTIEETAEALGISAATVKRDWLTARAWLHQALAA